MLDRKPIFPNVIEMNVQAGRLIGCNVYLIYDQEEWVLVDIGYEEDVEEIVDIIRQLDFPLANCKALIATHADVDHGQGFAKAKQMIGADVIAHPKAVELLEAGDRIQTFANIEAQGLDLAMPAVSCSGQISEGDTIQVGRISIDVWSTPGHAESQLAFRLRNLLLSGDNIYRDGCVGAIAAHHGSDIVAFTKSLARIRDSDVEWLLPSHGPFFRLDREMLQKTIERVHSYRNMADFGTCAVEWPLMDAWEDEIAEGRLPK